MGTRNLIYYLFFDLDRFILVSSGLLQHPSLGLCLDWDLLQQTTLDFYKSVSVKHR